LSELTSAVNAHLGLDGITYDYDNFEADLKDAVEGVENDVIAAEKALLLAQKDLQLVKEGKYDAVATAQRNLDAANAALTKAMEEYEEALSNLETALAIMAGEESAE
jgi:multidrug resistance efflux pump